MEITQAKICNSHVPFCFYRQKSDWVTSELMSICWEDHGSYWAQHVLRAEVKNNILSWKSQGYRNLAKDSGVNISIFMCHGLIAAGSQACALHTRGSWSSQLFLSRIPVRAAEPDLLPVVLEQGPFGGKSTIEWDTFSTWCIVTCI